LQKFLIMGIKENSKNNYQQLISDFIEDQYTTERLAKPEDVACMQDTSWLAETTVVENIVRKGETWKVYLVYAHADNPHTFIRRQGHTCRTAKLAEIVGSYTRTKVNDDDSKTGDIDNFGICWN